MPNHYAYHPTSHEIRQHPKNIHMAKYGVIRSIEGGGKSVLGWLDRNLNRKLYSTYRYTGSWRVICPGTNKNAVSCGLGPYVQRLRKSPNKLDYLVCCWAILGG